MRPNNSWWCALVLAGCGGAADAAPPEAPEPAATSTPSAPTPAAAEAKAAAPPNPSTPTEEPTPTVEPADAGVPVAEAAQPAAPEPVPLPKGTTVLHVGDSFAAALGISLNKLLKQHGVKGVLKYQTASFIPNWASRKFLPLYLAQTKPDFVIVTLGANEVEMKNPEIRAGLVKRLVGRIGDLPCVWIAPPMWKEDTGILNVIRDNCAPCRFMDTNALFDTQAMPRAPDGIHPSMPARDVWAKDVIDWLQLQLQPEAEKPWALREP